jgi:hypothetical protein
VKQAFVGKDHKGDVPLHLKIASGLTTGAIAITVASPTDLVKVRTSQKAQSSYGVIDGVLVAESGSHFLFMIVSSLPTRQQRQLISDDVLCSKPTTVKCVRGIHTSQHQQTWYTVLLLGGPAAEPECLMLTGVRAQ